MTIHIPLRFVETHRSAGQDALHPDAHIHAAVERANQIWSSTRIEFWVKSIERYHMPNMHKRYSSDKGWSYWHDLGGRLTSPPTVVSWGSDRLDVFVRGFTEQPAHQRYSNDQGWSGWRKL